MMSVATACQIFVEMFRTVSSKRYVASFMALVSLACLSGLSQWASAEPSSANGATYETTLNNKMRVIVREDRRAPTVAHMVWYRVGSMDEVDGRSGLAHLLEHMMFKGTTQVDAGAFSQKVAAAGGRDNAFTSRDYTAYFQQIPNDKLEEMMALEADRMQNLKIDPKAFWQELKVVQEERRLRTDDDPDAKLFEQMNAEAFQAHPYRRPVIGWRSDLEQMQPEDAQAWYDTWYMPNNAYLIVVGDVKHQQVFKLAAQHYGKLAARTLPQRRISAEPKQEGMRRIVVKAPAELPSVILAYKVPTIDDPAHSRDAYALEMLSAVLDGHDAARFNRRLVRERRVALSVGASYYSLSRGPGVFYLSGVPGKHKTPSELEAALKAEIGLIQREGVTFSELKRARAQLLASEVYKLDSMFGQAMEIGRTESSGVNWRQIPLFLEGLKRVSAAEVQAVAKKYFHDDTLTVGTLDPQPLNTDDTAVASAGRQR